MKYIAKTPDKNFQQKLCIYIVLVGIMFGLVAFSIHLRYGLKDDDGPRIVNATRTGCEIVGGEDGQAVYWMAEGECDQDPISFETICTVVVYDGKHNLTCEIVRNKLDHEDISLSSVEITDVEESER